MANPREFVARLNDLAQSKKPSGALVGIDIGATEVLYVDGRETAIKVFVDTHCDAEPTLKLGPLDLDSVLRKTTRIQDLIRDGRAELVGHHVAALALFALFK